MARGGGRRQGAIWSLQISPTGQHAVTGAADKRARFWEFELVAPPAAAGAATGTPAEKQLQVALERTLEMTDDVLCARYTPRGRYLSVALLDSTVKVRGVAAGGASAARERSASGKARRGHAGAAARCSARTISSSSSRSTAIDCL